MTPSTQLIAERLAQLANDMRSIVNLMQDSHHDPLWRQHSIELLGAAALTDEWVKWIREQDK